MDYQRNMGVWQVTKQQRRLAELKVVKVLKYWQDADIFRLDVKKKIAESTVAELEQFFSTERGLWDLKKEIGGKVVKES